MVALHTKFSRCFFWISMLAIGRRDNGAHGWGWVIWWVEFSCDGWNCNQFLGCVFGVSGKTIETPCQIVTYWGVWNQGSGVMVSISKGPLAVACNSIPCNIQCSLFFKCFVWCVVSQFVPVGSEKQFSCSSSWTTYAQRPEFMACKTKCSDVLLTPEQ
jgi:hypothetical protein